MKSETRPVSAGSNRSKSGSRTGKKKASAKVAAKATPKAKPAAKKTAKKAAKQTAKKAATRKTSSRTAPRKTATKTTRAKVAPVSIAPVVESVGRHVSADERRRMIAEAAYYRAERLGGRVDPTRNWLEAEAEIDAMLMGDPRAE